MLIHNLSIHDLNGYITDRLPSYTELALSYRSMNAATANFSFYSSVRVLGEGKRLVACGGKRKLSVRYAVNWELSSRYYVH